MHSLPFGSIDLRMPKKTHRRSRHAGAAGHLFKFFRRPIAQRRMQPAAIVVALDKVFDVATQMLQIAIVVGIDLLLLDLLLLRLYFAFRRESLASEKRHRNRFTLPHHVDQMLVSMLVTTGSSTGVCTLVYTQFSFPVSLCCRTSLDDGVAASTQAGYLAGCRSDEPPPLPEVSS